MLTMINAVNGSFSAIIMVISGLIGIVCLKLWLTIVAFTVRWWWGLVALFIPFGSLIFTIMNWKVAKKPFLVAASFLGVAIITFILRSFFATFFDLTPGSAVSPS